MTKFTRSLLSMVLAGSVLLGSSVPAFAAAVDAAQAVFSQNHPEDVIHVYDNGPDAQEAPGPYERELFTDDFSNGNNWKTSNNNVKFEGGKAIIQGGGPNNAMLSKSKVLSNNFLIQTDMTFGPTQKEGNIKVAFKAADSFEGDRLQVRFRPKEKEIIIERVNGNTTTKSYATKYNVNFELGKTYQITIEVQDDTITLWMDEEQVLTAKDASIASMPQGHLLIAGQYPAQDVSVDNIKVTTKDVPQGPELKVSSEVYTNGELNGAGGTLTLDRESGHHGDWVTVSTTVNHGYELQKVITNTDNLVPIENNRFQLNEKFPEIVVQAYFVDRQPGRDEIYYNDFYETTGANPELGVTIADGKLNINPPQEKGMGYYTPEVQWDKLAANGNHRVLVDAERLTSQAGTMQIAFRQGADVNERYVFALNTSGRAMIRHITPQGNDPQGNDELAWATFQFQANKPLAVDIEVVGNTVTVYLNGNPTLSYTSEEGWGNTKPAATLINMTAGAPLAFDDLLIEKVPDRKPIVVKSYCNGQLDEDYLSGAAAVNQYVATVGDEVTLTATPKAGYQLKEYQVMTEEPMVIEGNTFTMPEGSFETLEVRAIFEPVNLRAPQTFYIDSQNGDDSASGTSEAEAWKSLSKVRDYELFVPGDQILFKRGSVFTGEQLTFRGMGAEGKPIVIGAYGEGNLPRFDGAGQVENVVYLSNQEHITIQDLEITNLDPTFNTDFQLNGSNNRSKNLRAIRVMAQDFGVVSGITIQNCYIHDINGTISAKWNGGVFFDVTATVENMELKGIPTKYDSILIENNTFERVDRSAIKLVSSKWCGQWEKNDPTAPIHWYPSTNVVVRGNYMEYIGGDGITVRDTDGALIEYNLAKDCRYQDTGYNVGIWPFQAANTVMQFNESYNTHGTTDGQGLDCDHASSNSVAQYNYSHNNEGGFMLIMGGYPHTGATVRYNISQNDRDKTFEFAQGMPRGTMIYNNTIYSDQTVRRGVFLLSNTGVGQGVFDTFVFNNAFHYPEGQDWFTGEVEKLKTNAKLYNNAYFGITPYELDENPITGDFGWVNPGKAPEDNTSGKPITGESGLLDGYKLKETSILIDKGITMDEALDYYGATGVVDGRDLSPRELFDQAKAENRPSINCVVGHNFPEIPGVSYDKDFFGVTVDGTPDIGAAEYTTAHTVYVHDSYAEVSGAGDYQAGETVTIQAGSREGYTFAGWTAEGVTLADASQTTTTFVMPEQNVIVTANWSKDEPEMPTKYTVTVEGSYAQASGAGEYEAGETVTIQAGSRSSYSFVDWTAEGVTLADAGQSTTTFVMPEQNVTVTANWRYRGSGGSSGGNQSETVTNPDGSTTTTVTKPDGTTVETTTDKAGNKTETTTKPDGSSITKVNNKDGSSSVTIVDVNGQMESQVNLPKDVVSQAAQDGKPVALPMPSVSVTTQKESAPVVTISLPEGMTARVAIPVDGQQNRARAAVQPGMAGVVALRVHKDGTQEIVKTSLMTKEGLLVSVSNGDTIKVVDNHKTFQDVSRNYWGRDAIDFAASREIFSGISAATFAPEMPMNRAMIVTVLAGLDGVDTSAGTVWYEAGQKWAVEHGISDGSNLDSSLSREQLATMLWRYAGSPKAEQDLSQFADQNTISPWARDAMAWAVSQGLISGMGNGSIVPQGEATRAQVAAMLMAFVPKMP